DVGAHQGADDAHGRRAFEAERVAHGNDEVADLEVVGVAERHERQVGGVDPQQRHVGADIAPDQVGVEYAAVGERDHDGGGVGYDVVVGDDQAAGGIDDHARAAGLERLPRRPDGQRPLAPDAGGAGRPDLDQPVALAGDAHADHGGDHLLQHR